MKLSQIRLLTDNFKESFNFYKNILGLKVSWGNENDSYASFSTALSEIAIFDKSAMFDSINMTKANLTNSCSFVIVLEVENVDEFYNSVKDKVKSICKPTNRIDWGIKTFHFSDPDGNIIEVNQAIN